MAADAVGGKCILRIWFVGFRWRDQLLIEMADETFGMTWSAHLDARREADCGDSDGSIMANVTCGALIAGLVAPFVRHCILSGVVKFYPCRERCTGCVLLEEIDMFGVRIIIKELRGASASRVRESTDVGRHLFRVECQSVVADRAHLARHGRSGEGVTFGAGRMRFLSDEAGFMARITDRSQIMLIFAQFVLHCIAVAIGAIQIDRLRFVDQAFNLAGMRFVCEFREFGRSSCATLRSARYGRGPGRNSEQRAGNQKNYEDVSFH